MSKQDWLLDGRIEAEAAQAQADVHELAVENEQLRHRIDALTQERDDLAERCEQAWATAEAERAEMHETVRRLRRDLRDATDTLTRCQARGAELLKRARAAEHAVMFGEPMTRAEAGPLPPNPADVIADLEDTCAMLRERELDTYDQLRGAALDLNPKRRGSTAWRLERLCAAAPRAMAAAKERKRWWQQLHMDHMREAGVIVNDLKDDLTIARGITFDCKHDDCDGQALPGLDECLWCRGCEVVEEPGPPLGYETWADFRASVEADKNRPANLDPETVVRRVKRRMAEQQNEGESE